MSVATRKPRPLSRGNGTMRDDRLFIVACDDTYAPAQYFNFFNLPRVQVHVIPTRGGTAAAKHVLTRLLEVDHEEDDERWMLLDTDHYTQKSHIRGFTETITDAKRNRINIALSRPCFELWLLLHHVEESAVGSLENAKETESALRKQLGEYNKTHLKNEHYLLASVRDACERAQRLDRTVNGNDIPASNTSRVYLLWKAIVANVLPMQLPPELRNLLQ